MEPNEIDWERLDRYVAREGTPEDLAALDRWVRCSPKRLTIAEVMRTAQRLPDQSPAMWHAQESWLAVTERLGLPRDPAREPHDRAHEPTTNAPPLRAKSDAPRRVPTLKGVDRTRSSRRFFMAAALIAAAIVAVLGGHWLTNEFAGRRAGSVAGAREYVAPRGQRMIIHLSDRTEIRLAPDTRLRLSGGDGRSAREVELEGQAYFDVSYDAARPFIVRTKNIIARDLGTRFSVRAYAGDADTEVVVAEGSVALGRALSSQPQDDSVLLERGDVGRLTAEGDLVRTRGVAVDRLLAWTDGELVFRRTPLREAVVELGRWYDVDIQLADSSFADERVTASFKDEPPSVAVGLVATAAGLDMRQTGSRFTLQRSPR